MRKCFAIIRYEYIMQIKRVATWGVFAVAMAMALMDNFPSQSNLARLQFLIEPDYFIYRTMRLGSLILVFGQMFLLSNRFNIDKQTAVKSLIMASPVSKSQYISGKILGGFCYTFTLLIFFLIINTLIYIMAIPKEILIADWLIPLLKTIAVCAIPVSIFISFISVSLPAIIDIRLFYLLASVLFIINAATVGSAEEMPFYLITSGDLSKLIWHHPNWPFTNIKSAADNLIFLISCGFMTFVILIFNRKLWRTEK